MTRSVADLLGLDSPPPSNLPAVDAATMADILGIAESTVRRLAPKGVFRRVGVNTFDIRESVRGWLAHTAKEKPTDADRARRERAEADLAEAKAAKLKGELVPVAEAEATWTGICRDIRSGLLAVPSRVRARLPALTTAEVGVIDSEVRLALTALGDADA